MRKITSNHKIEYFQSKIFDTYFGGQSLVVFDIESMGLNPKVNEVVLAAFLEVTPDGDATVTQYLLDSMEEEVMLLSIIQDKLNSFDVVLTYNGKHFDLPFIKTRAQILGMRDMGMGDYNIKPYDLDLYLVLHGHSELKRILPNLKQKTIEEYMGLSTSRDDEISGAESVELFKEYLSTFDMDYRESLARKILLHNHDDVLQLYKLLPVIKKSNFHQAMAKLGFPVLNSLDFHCDITSVKMSSDELIITGTHNRQGFSYISFASEERPYNAEFKKDFTFNISVLTKRIGVHDIVNTRQIGLNDGLFDSLGGFTNGYLIVQSENALNPLEANILAKSLILLILNQ